ncbi:hypothetical protein [Amycolatopsis sp. lyj-23]|uniref:DUF4760 domain-containing protein n=1 Tax=Amycolatopsis sp. lyj-23 TaxID=2789283 RepID=UPI00397D636E
MSATALLTLVSPLVAAAVAVWGFRRSTKADKLRAFFELQDRYLQADVRAGRRVLHQQIADRGHEEVAGLDRATLSSAGYALAVLNGIAIAVEGGYVERELIIRGMGRSFASAITAARPYIDYVEQVRGFRPYPFAERLSAGIHTEIMTRDERNGDS